MPSKQSPESTETTEYSFANPTQRFLIGVVLSGVPIVAYLSLSVDMSGGGWTAVGAGKLAIAIFIPLLWGGLAVFWGQRVIRFLSTLLESVNLPF
ncbi:hypothetical protein C7271_09125 [filamentous cyanobacterium CCP5]|nr:hypothetical protein C7271_09125 [filamentous cyanobacterium CCP5]